ncbi:hypothetical protein CYMTET_39989 [Cymbomonas tetramitiformis]|uniref:Uncharacterized protein n=1 Tax=Cymbomonas tetramitiformis TaxID=36881 RepID=A0AAE0F3Z3_9CHLO|nr:hypothetical protein CYMTET_39989 [Cymbomonas tetramitiformis]
MTFDGQYFNLDVPGFLCDMIGTSVEWTMPGWDGGHRTELVLADVRKDEVLTWYKDTPETINEIHSKEIAQNGKDEQRAYAGKFLSEMYKLVFVVTVLGLADLLAKVKEVSLFQQTVDTLPWEVTEKEAQFAHSFDVVYTK